MKSAAKPLFVIATIALILALVFGIIGFNKITQYENSDNSWGKHVNAYVGGDAYNYIINGTYFAGYCALSGACLICACVTFSAGMKLKSSENSQREVQQSTVIESDELPDL